MDQKTLEKRVRKIRFHLTRSLTKLPKFSSKSKIKKNRKSFYRLLNAEYKTAQELLISTYLELEEDIEKYGDAPDVKKKKYWKMILELCFNTFVWIAEGWDRDLVKRVFKGPKHGSSKSRNVISVLNVIRRFNKRWNDFAIALDFSSFECITDILRVHIHPELKGIQNHYIEVKEGKTNIEMINTIKSRSQEVYFSFFDKYGERGVKQIERHFRQRRTADEHLSIMRADQGGVFDTKDGKVHVLLASIPRMYYVKGVKNLLKYLKSSPLVFFVVDECLWVGAARISEPKDLEVADFLVRHSIHHFFSPECAMCTNQAGWQKELADLKIFDGLRMFGSVPFEGLIGKPISDRDMLDILFGRIRFFYHLDGDRFIDLCGKIGLKAGYSTEKEFNRWRSSGHHYVIGFKNRLLWTKSKKGEATFYFTEGVLHDMCLNWIHPYWWARQDFDALFSATNNMQGAEISRAHVRFPASSSR